MVIMVFKKKWLISLLCFILLLMYYKSFTPIVHEDNLYLNTASTCRSTLVSAYYNISSKHSPAEYMQWMENFLSLQDCMVIFTSEDVLQTIQNLRPPSLPLKIILRSLKSFPVAQELDEKGWELQEKLDPELDVGHSRELYWIWNGKSGMLREVTELNPFSSVYFAWLDIGAIRHKWWNGKKLMQKLPKDPGILLLQVGEFTQEDLKFVNGISQADFFQENRIGGGMIGGDIKHIHKWNNLYYKTLRRYFDMNKFGGKDQSIMATTCLESDICLLLDGSPFFYWIYNQPRWFRLQEYYMGRLDDEPTRLNISKA